MTENDTSKKSETIEVRVSYVTKQALKDKCQSEGETVSSVMRRLIHQFLESASDKSEQASIWRKLMTFAVEKPRRLIAAAVTCITLIGFALAPIRAEEVSLKVTGSVLTRDGDDVHSADIKTTLIADYNDKAAIRIEHDDGTVYLITLTAVPAKDDSILIISEIATEQNGEKKIVATPSLLAKFDASARIEIGQQDTDGRPRDISYQLEILPTKL